MLHGMDDAQFMAEASELLRVEMVRKRMTQRRLAKLDLWLYPPDVFLDVAVGGEDIGAAVEIVVEEKDTECQREQTRAAHRAARCFVHEETVALIVIET